MKGLTVKRPWTQTLAWLAAVLAAILLAFLVPEAFHFPGLRPELPQGAAAPR